MARPLLTFEKRRGETGNWTIISDDSASPTILATWSMSKDDLPDFSDLGFRVVGDMFVANGGDGDPATTVGFGVIVGGGPLDLVGIRSGYAFLTGYEFQQGPENIIYGSERLQIDGSTLFQGRDMEFVKLVGWYDLASGLQPSSDNFALMVSGAQPVDTCGLPFHFDSVQTFAGGTKLRLWFTRETAAGAGPSDFTLTPTSGQGAPTITVVSKASDDADVYDLYLSAPMPTGTYTMTVADTLLSATGHGLLEPRSFAFDWTPIAQEPIAHGGQNDAAEQQFLRNLNPAFRNRPNWKALAAALAAGDAMTREDARLAFDQLYISSARGKYLERRAGDHGIEKPFGPGLSDDVFRQLALAVKNDKLTAHALLDVAEVFYGPDAVHAYIETEIPEPFHIIAGATLVLLVDERTEVEVAFPRSAFTKALRASADEVTAAITRALEARRLKAWAVPHVNPDTGLRHVRVYSGTKGLDSSMRCIGGTAQPVLRFPTPLFVEPDAVLASYGTWDVTKPDTTTQRWAYTGTFYSFRDLRVGDYVVVRGIEFDPANRGGGVITAVNFQPGNNYFEVQNLAGVAQAGANQCEFGDIEFFRATRRTSYDSPAYAILHQAGGRGFATIAATTRAIERHRLSGAYAQVADPVVGATISRDSGGVVTVTTAAPHGLAVGAWFALDGDGGFAGPGMTGDHQVVTAADATTLTYSTPDHAWAAVGAGDFTVTPLAAPAGQAAGPFLFDAGSGFGLSGIDGTVQDRLEVGQRYALLRLAPGEGADFPDEEGWLVFRLGYSNQVGPVKYLGNTGADTLLLDASFPFPATIVPGSFVTLLETRGPFVPAHPERVGAFYVTDSPSGRVAAEATMRAISASGIDLDVDIRYPGDRGLGGEGLPARGSYKLSDKVAVWGGGNLDAELEDKRGA